MTTADAGENYGKPLRGYPIECLKEETLPDINSKGLICVLCQNILRSPVQVPCGARYCEECYKGLLRDVGDRVISCPSCKLEGVENIHLTQKYHPDTFCRKQVKLVEARCQFAARGCPWTGKLIDCEEHAEVCPFQNSVDPISDNGTKKPCSSCCHEDVRSTSHIEGLCSRLTQLDPKMTSLLLTAPKNGYHYQHMSKPIPINGIVDTTESASLNLDQYEALLNKYKTHTNLMAVLFKEVQVCSRTLMAKDSTTDPEVETVKQRITDLEKQVKVLQGMVPTMERMFNGTQTISINARLTWRIENISKKIEDAQSGETPALYSPPFFSDDAGYKMCARLYLNGDGLGKETHVSLFFVIMRGPYDTILSWPFNHRVTLQLLDQSGQGNHIQEKFKSDPGSPCFKQPRSEMNAATGCPRFISKPELERRKDFFMKGDTMFIRVIVE